MTKSRLGLSFVIDYGQFERRGMLSIVQDGLLSAEQARAGRQRLARAEVARPTRMRAAADDKAQLMAARKAISSSP